MVIIVKGWNSDRILSDELVGKLQSKVIDHLCGPVTTVGGKPFSYTVGDKPVTGQSFSFLQDQLAWDGFKNIGSLHCDFKNVMEALGFKVSEGRNCRNQKCTVVYL